MDEVRIVRQRTHIWPVIIALIVLAIVLGYVFFAKSGPANTQVGWNDVRSGFSQTVRSGVSRNVGSGFSRTSPGKAVRSA
jgi:hypothetical protein